MAAGPGHAPAGFAATELAADGLEDLQELLGCTPNAWVVADLSLGAWRGGQVARELAGQLGLARPSPSPPAAALADGAFMSYADVVGRSIDRESGGDAMILDAFSSAHELADEICRQHVNACVILAPRHGQPWRRHDELVVRYLAEHLAGRGPALVLAHIRSANSAAAIGDAGTSGRTLALVPGVLGPEELPAVAVLLAQLLLDRDCRLQPLRNERLLIDPAARRDPASAPAACWQRLASVGRRSGWLAGYAQLFLDDAAADPALLARQAALRHAEMGEDVALHMLERAARACEGDARARLQAYAQGIRISGQRFAEAATVDQPSPGIDPMLRGFLAQCRGWGLVMQGRPEEAIANLEHARELLEPVRDAHPRELLWLANITALARLRSGDGDGALALEREIERALASRTPTDWHLRYVNALNIARLLRRRGDLAAAQRYFRAGFETAAGAQSFSDAVYRNVCLATVANGPGAARQALVHWLRASLHWLANPVAESIAPRVVRGIVGRDVDDDRDVVRCCAEHLAGHLTDAAARAGAAIGAEPLILHRARIAGAGAVRGAARRIAVGAPGWSVLVADGDIDTRDLGPAHEALLALVLGVVEQALAPLAIAPSDPVVLVDDRDGREMAGTAAELELVAARHGAACVVFDGAATDLDATAREGILQAAVASLSPAVETLHDGPTGTHVRFRRYRAPLTVPDRDARLLTRLRTPTRLRDLGRAHPDGRRSEPLADVLALAGQGVVVLDPPQADPRAGRAAAVARRSGA